MSSQGSTQSRQAKTFVLSAIALSAATFDLGFWYGIFETVFFEKLFFVWVAATVALIASHIVRGADPLPSGLRWYGRLTLLLPSIWLIMELLIDVNAPASAGTASWTLWLMTLLVAFVTLPYLIYLIILVVVPDIDQLKQPRLRFAVIGIAAAMGLCGLVIGKNHFVFLTCEEFKVAGDDVPSNCRSIKPSK